MDHDNLESLTWDKRKKIRLKKLSATRSYALNPVRQYEHDIMLVLRSLARFIINQGYCPQAKVIARRRTWLVAGTIAYLEDLAKEGMVELFSETVWNVTPKGWAQIGAEPVAPLLPPGLTLSTDSMREARTVARRLKDPDILAAYEALYEKQRGKA